MTPEEICKKIEGFGWELILHKTTDNQSTAQIYDPSQARPGMFLAPFAAAWHSNPDEALRDAYQIALEIKGMVKARDEAMAQWLAGELVES